VSLGDRLRQVADWQLYGRAYVCARQERSTWFLARH
jgi:hypothetical protein